MPSPVCTVNSLDATDGVDVSALENVAIELADTAGVKSWTVACIGTDENNTPTGVMGSLDIDSVTKTAGFQSPDDGGLGAAMIWQSTVTDIHDVATSTTFGIYVRAVNGLRICAVNETTEGDAGYGWTSKINDAIRGALGIGVTSAVAATPNTVALRDGSGNTMVASLQTGGITTGDGVNLYIQPGRAPNGSGGFVTGTVYNTVFWGGTVGNSTHGWQAGAITYNTPQGLVFDFHGVGDPTAGANQGKVNRFVHGYGGSSNGYAYGNIDVDVNFNGAYSINPVGSVARVQIVLDASNTLGFRIYDTAGTKTLFEATHAGGVTVDGPLATKSGSSIAIIDSLGNTCLGLNRLSSSVVQLATGAGYGITLSSNNTFSVAAGNNVISLQAGTAYINGVSSQQYWDTDDFNLRPKSGASTWFRAQSTGFTVGLGPMTWATAVTTPTISQADNTTNSATAQPMAVKAQNATGTTSTGGDLLLQPGTGTTANGKLKIANVATTTTAPGAGGAGALPATPAGYMTINVNGTDRKVPYY